MSKRIKQDEVEYMFCHYLRIYFRHRWVGLGIHKETINGIKHYGSQMYTEHAKNILEAIVACEPWITDEDRKAVYTLCFCLRSRGIPVELRDLIARQLVAPLLTKENKEER